MLPGSEAAPQSFTPNCAAHCGIRECASPARSVQSDQRPQPGEMRIEKSPRTAGSSGRRYIAAIYPAMDTPVPLAEVGAASETSHGILERGSPYTRCDDDNQRTEQHRYRAAAHSLVHSGNTVTCRMTRHGRRQRLPQQCTVTHSSTRRSSQRESSDGGQYAAHMTIGQLEEGTSRICRHL